MAWSPMGKSCSFGLQYVFGIMSRENNDTLNDNKIHRRLI